MTDNGYHSDSIAVDGAGNAVVAGDTYSASFPTTAGAYQVTGVGADAFIVKLNSTGAGVVFSTYLGGSYDTRASGVALDTAGNIYTTGMTESQDFPTTSGAFQPQSYDVGNNKDDSGSDAFVTELSADGSRLLYSTYFGGEGYEDVQGVDGVFDPPIGGIAVDASGMIYVTGNAGGYDFPKKFPFQTHDNSEASQAFVAKFDPTQAGNNSLVYSTILGNTNPNDRTQGGGCGIAAYTDSSGNTFAYVTGFTTANKIPTTANAFNQNGGHFAQQRILHEARVQLSPDRDIDQPDAGDRLCLSASTSNQRPGLSDNVILENDRRPAASVRSGGRRSLFTDSRRRDLSNAEKLAPDPVKAAADDAGVMDGMSRIAVAQLILDHHASRNHEKVLHRATSRPINSAMAEKRR